MASTFDCTCDELGFVRIRSDASASKALIKLLRGIGNGTALMRHLLPKSPIVVATILLIMHGASAQNAPAVPERFPGTSWQDVAPADAGWSSKLLSKAESWSQQIGLTAVMIVQHGSVVAAWGDTKAKTPLASVRKSLLSALIGIAVERHQIRLSQPIGELGIDDNAPSLTDAEKRATVRDLLEARSGIYHSALYETPQMAALRPPRGSHAPGEFWYYNYWDSNALGAIYLHATGSSVFDAFQREIAGPIGMEDYQPSDGTYATGKVSVYPAYLIQMSARDLARFALLYLSRGQWRGRQIVPARWVEESTRPYSQSGFGPGYGYLWWTGFVANGFAPTVNLPPGSYFAWGSRGQFAFVIPACDMVIVFRNAMGKGPSLPHVARLLWMILAANHVSDIGPDTSIETASGTRADNATLGRILPGATLRYGDRAKGGPFETLLNADGSAEFFKGRPPTRYDSGTWRITGDQLCREREKTATRQACFSVVVYGHSIKLFDRFGVMQVDARLKEK